MGEFLYIAPTPEPPKPEPEHFCYRTRPHDRDVTPYSVWRCDCGRIYQLRARNTNGSYSRIRWVQLSRLTARWYLWLAKPKSKA